MYKFKVGKKSFLKALKVKKSHFFDDLRRVFFYAMLPGLSHIIQLQYQISENCSK